MTNRERVKAVLNGQMPADRLPMVEWATYWDKTTAAWEEEGLKAGLGQQGISDSFGLDPLVQYWIRPTAKGCPGPKETHGGIAENEQEYEKILPFLYTDTSIRDMEEQLRLWKPAHDRGDFALWFTLEGFFWFPRTLLGIENHLYAFYDQPELIHRMNRDQLNFSLKAVDVLCKIVKPEFMTFAEDMSYNHGPMLSKELFDQFLAPYYKEIIPVIKQNGIKVLIDTDGNVEPLISWFEECGIEGVLPLERQAGVDVNRIRQNHPEWLMVGGYDKTIMHKGEDAMRQEFNRIMPAMKSGRYIPSVDHQTPPDVSMEQYKIYVKLLREYAEKAINGD